jgi:hypothetical protein
VGLPFALETLRFSFGTQGLCPDAANEGGNQRLKIGLALLALEAPDGGVERLLALGDRPVQLLGIDSQGLGAAGATDVFFKLSELNDRLLPATETGYFDRSLFDHEINRLRVLSVERELARLHAGGKLPACRSPDARRMMGTRACPAEAVPLHTTSVQLSENANADVEKGRPSRSRFQDCPLASMPLRTRRVPSAGINTVHTP